MNQFENGNVSSDNDKYPTATNVTKNSESNYSSKKTTPKRNVSHEIENKKGRKTKEAKF
jgi:hypothetical protein